MAEKEEGEGKIDPETRGTLLGAQMSSPCWGRKVRQVGRSEDTGGDSNWNTQRSSQWDM